MNGFLSITDYLNIIILFGKVKIPGEKNKYSVLIWKRLLTCLGSKYELNWNLYEKILFIQYFQNPTFNTVFIYR